MRRREVLALLGGVVAWSTQARTQQAERVRRVGVLTNLAEDDPETRSRLDAFVKNLQRLGWTEGVNLRIDYRWGAGDTDSHRKNAAELVALAPDVVVAHGSTIMGPLQRATATCPLSSCRFPIRWLVALPPA